MATDCRCEGDSASCVPVMIGCGSRLSGSDYGSFGCDSVLADAVPKVTDESIFAPLRFRVASATQFSYPLTPCPLSHHSLGHGGGNKSQGLPATGSP